MEANSCSPRTLTALAVTVSALGYGGVISLDYYIFATQAVFTTRMVPQVWRLFTAFLITKPKFGILLDPYFMYQYGSGIERESSRFSQPGDFFVYTAVVGSIIVVSLEVCFSWFCDFFHWTYGSTLHRQALSMETSCQ